MIRYDPSTLADIISVTGVVTIFIVQTMERNTLSGHIRMIFLYPDGYGDDVCD